MLELKDSTPVTDPATVQIWLSSAFRAGVFFLYIANTNTYKHTFRSYRRTYVRLCTHEYILLRMYTHIYLRTIVRTYNSNISKCEHIHECISMHASTYSKLANTLVCTMYMYIHIYIRTYGHIPNNVHMYIGIYLCIYVQYI